MIKNVTFYGLLLCLSFPLLSFANDNAAPTMYCLQQNLRIAIDTGHSPLKGGARSARGRMEYDFNKAVADRVQQRLHKIGFKQAYLLTKNNPEMPLHARASLANAKKTDLLISIHHDSAQAHYFKSWMYEDKEQHYSDKFRGYSVFVSGKNAQFATSQRFASLLAEELLSLDLSPTLHHAEAIKGENRALLNKAQGVYQYDNLLILKASKAPAILLESGVIINRDEELRLLTPLYQNTLVTAIERAVLSFAQTECAE